MPYLQVKKFTSNKNFTAWHFRVTILEPREINRETTGHVCVVAHQEIYTVVEVCCSYM
jgi:hypothetical protein